MTSREGVEQLLYLLDEAFEGSREHSLLANLRTVTEADWLWVPPGGTRSIRDIVVHVGECKYVYQNHAFGDGTMRWDVPGSVPTVRPEDRAETVTEGLREGHRHLRDSLAALAGDSELLGPRKTNWGEMAETRWIISVMIEHDLYHAGELNHLRALRQGNDAWVWPSAGREIARADRIQSREPTS